MKKNFYKTLIVSAFSIVTLGHVTSAKACTGYIVCSESGKNVGIIKFTNEYEGEWIPSCGWPNNKFQCYVKNRANVDAKYCNKAFPKECKNNCGEGMATCSTFYPKLPKKEMKFTGD